MQADIQQAKNNQQTIPAIPLVNENQNELDEYARALTTMETIITQLQLLPYRHIPNLIHDALDQVINPTTRYQTWHD